MTAASPYVEVSGVSFSYGDRTVLRDVSLSVGPGEFVVLVGPNGAGKSTLLRLLTRLLPPSTGEIRLGGDPVSRLPLREMARRVAVVPQETPLEFDFTAFELVLMGRTPHRGPIAPESANDRERARDAMAMTGTTEFAERSIRELSGGERQRVIIARALAQEGQLLLLDEPTAHLDLNHQIEILDLVQELCRKQPLAVLAVLHDLNLASAFADRIVALQDGSVAADGPPEQVITPDLLDQVFHAHVQIIPHPETSRPAVLIGRAKAEEQRMN